MTVTENEVLGTARPEPRRDQYDRALLLDKQGQRRPYTRVSTLAKALDDKGSLINYNQRLTAVGLTKRKDLLDIVAMMSDPEGTDKGELRRLVEEAANAGGQGVKANMGTARHKATERIDAGEPIANIAMPDDIKRDVEAYYAELDRVGLRPLPQYNEVHVVRDDFDYNGCGYSGSFDKCLGDGSDLFIGDIKTGQELKFAFLSWAVQQACYAHAESIYEVRNDTRLAMPNVRKDVAFIIWLPAGRGKCQILEVDIANGWRYAQLAVEFRRVRAHGRVDIRRDGCLVREYVPAPRAQTLITDEAAVRAGQPKEAMATWNKRPDGSNEYRVPISSDITFNAPAMKATPSGLVELVPSGEPTVRQESAGAIDEIERENSELKRRDWLRDRLKNASEPYRAMVATWWGEWNARSQNGGIAGLSSDHIHTPAELDQIEAWCNEAEKATQETLTADPTKVAAASLLKHFPGTIDEGTYLSEDEMTKLSANLAIWCPPKHLGLLQVWREEAIRLGRDFGIKECPTSRRAKIYELGALMCNLLEGDNENIDLAWATLVTALGWSSVPDTQFGLALALLTIEDLDKAIDLTYKLDDYELVFEGLTPRWRLALQS